MAVPTEAQIKTMLTSVVKMYDQARLAGGVTTSGTNQNSTSLTNWVTLETTLLGQLYGDYAPALMSAVRNSRRNLAAMVSPSEFTPALSAGLRMYGQYLNVPEGDSASILSRIYDDYILNTKRVMSRGFTFGAATNGSPMVGNGLIHRLNVDENGLAIENQTADVKTMECVIDSNLGVGRNEEIFEFRGQSANRDLLIIAGSGAKANIQALSARSSLNLLRNPSFSSLSGTATVPTAITSWTSSVSMVATVPTGSNAVSASTYQFLTDTYANQGVLYYRDFPGDSTPYALQSLTVNFCVSQPLENNRSQFVLNNPYYCQVAYKKSASGVDGTLTLGLGAVTATVDLTTINDTSWHILKIPLGTGCWFKNFDQANMQFYIQRSGATATGNLTIDDVILAPMTNFDGGWYAIVGGTTQFLKRDILTATDSELGENYGIIQKFIGWRGYGRYIPAQPKAPTGTIAAALAGAGAGNVDNGAHTYAFTYVDNVGVESGLSGTAVATVVDKTTNGKVSVSSIAVGPSGTASRKVYRSKAATTTPLYLLTTLSDNSTTTFTDNLADASITVAASTAVTGGITWSDPS